MAVVLNAARCSSLLLKATGRALEDSFSLEQKLLCSRQHVVG